jgi:hypothetical protein
MNKQGNHRVLNRRNIVLPLLMLVTLFCLGVFLYDLTHVSEDLTRLIMDAIGAIWILFICLWTIHRFGLAGARSTGLLKSAAPNISKAPGGSLLMLVEYLYSPKTVEEVFKPIIADWRTEYFDALKEGQNRKASWISVRYIFSFGMAMGLSKVISVIRSVARR